MKLHEELAWLAVKLKAGLISQETIFEDIKILERRYSVDHQIALTLRKAIATQSAAFERYASILNSAEKHQEVVKEAKKIYDNRLKEINDMT